MKQVLLHSNDTYLFPLPRTYSSLIREISNKTSLEQNNINIYHKGQVVTKTNFQNINENLNLIDISPKLNGGGGFPNFTKMVVTTILQNILTASIGTFVLILIIMISTYSLEPPEIRSKGAIYTLKTLKFFPKFNNVDLKKEFLFFGIFYYIFSIVPALSILSLKSQKCPTYSPPWSSLLFFAAIPFPILLVLCFIQKSSKPGMSTDPSILYMIVGAVFTFCGYQIMNLANNSLKEWEHEDSETDLYKIPSHAAVWYCLLRFLLIWGNNTYNFFKGMIMIGVIFFFVTVAVSPDYVDAYLRYISSPFSRCPQ
jgi:hypothetical protein